MKSIISFLVVLSFAGAAIAQEESPSPSSEEKTPAASEEKASATVEETPAATIVATPKASVAAKESTAAAKKEASPAAPAAKKTTATAAAAPAASTGKSMGGEAGVKDMENKWEASVATHNYSMIEGYIAADFIGVSSKGKFVNRSEILSEAKGDKDTYKSTKNEKLNVKMYGPDVAVVTGRAREVGTGKDGKAFDRTFLFTDTWMMRSGKWQCIGSQVNKIKG
jgi:hypothetical protein